MSIVRRVNDILQLAVVANLHAADLLTIQAQVDAANLLHELDRHVLVRETTLNLVAGYLQEHQVTMNALSLNVDSALNVVVDLHLNLKYVILMHNLFDSLYFTASTLLPTDNDLAELVDLRHAALLSDLLLNILHGVCHLLTKFFGQLRVIFLVNRLRRLLVFILNNVNGLGLVQVSEQIDANLRVAGSHSNDVERVSGLLGRVLRRLIILTIVGLLHHHRLKSFCRL